MNPSWHHFLLLLPSSVPFFLPLLLTNPNEPFSYLSPTYSSSPTLPFSLLRATHPFPNLLLIFFWVMVDNRIIILLIFFFVSKRKRNHNSTIDFSTTESQFKYYFFEGLKYTKRNHDFVVDFASTHNGITILLYVLYNKILISWGGCFWNKKSLSPLSQEQLSWSQ